VVIKITANPTKYGPAAPVTRSTSLSSHLKQLNTIREQTMTCLVVETLAAGLQAHFFGLQATNHRFDLSESQYRQHTRFLGHFKKDNKRSRNTIQLHQHLAPNEQRMWKTHKQTVPDLKKEQQPATANDSVQESQSS
jgi:hypothetical protein